MTYSALFHDNSVISAMKQPRRFIVATIAGYIPAIWYSPEPRRMIRRLAGMAWKAMWDVPDRVAERSIPGKVTLKE